MGSPYTNMIFGNLNQNSKISMKELSDLLVQNGILVGIVNEHRFRLVLHNDILNTDIDPILAAFHKVFNAS